MTWQDRAACAGVDDDALFFPGMGHDAGKDAVALVSRLYCDGCPVRRECAAAALATPGTIGIWAGVLLRSQMNRPAARAALTRIAQQRELPGPRGANGKAGGFRHRGETQ